MTLPHEYLYGIPTYLLALVTLALVFGLIALGTRIGARRRGDPQTSQVSALRAGLMGLLALLVGFSFSMAVGRHDDRARAVLAEGNAIGTAWLRTDLLSGPERDALRAAMADYAQSRLKASGFDLYDADAAAQEAIATETAFGAAWTVAATAARGKPNEATGAVFAALNDMTDAATSNDAALNRHMPEPLLYMILLTLLFLGWVVGYASGEAGEKTPAPMLLMVVLIVALQSLILDVDRPRRGVIQVDQTPLVQAVAHVLKDMGRPLGG